VSTFRYEVMQASWGIVVTIDAEASDSAEAPTDRGQVAPGLWLDPGEVRLWPEGFHYLALGLRIVASEIKRTTAAPHVQVVLRTVDFAETDFQDEGLAPAIAGWAAQHFGFAAPAIPVRYDKFRGRYDFDLPERMPIR
jgi:hypothetical protein